MTRSIHFNLYETEGAFVIDAATGGPESFTLNIHRPSILTPPPSAPEPKPAPRRRPPAKKKPAARRRR